jgi:hypothetical protein
MYAVVKGKDTLGHPCGIRCRFWDPCNHKEDKPEPEDTFDCNNSLRIKRFKALIKRLLSCQCDDDFKCCSLRFKRAYYHKSAATGYLH